MDQYSFKLGREHLKLVDGGLSIVRAIIVVICTGRAYQEIAERWTVHPHVRVLLKPMDLELFEDAIRWLAGAEDSSSWPTPKPIPRS